MILSLIKAARPITLIASLAPVLVGTAVAMEHTVQFHYDLFALIISCAVLLQIASNYLNDALDFKKGADTENRLGPTRVSQSGLLKETTVYYAGITCLVIALICGFPLVMQGGFPILAIGASAVFFAYIYTGGPYPLAYNGFGELFAMVYYGVIAVTGTTYLYLHFVPVEGWIRGIQIGCFATALIALNNFRDIAEDRSIGKKTIAVRKGEKFGKAIILSMLHLPWVIELFFFQYPNSIFILIVLSYTVWVSFNIAPLSPSRECNKFLGKISKAEFFFALACIGLAFLQP